MASRYDVEPKTIKPAGTSVSLLSNAQLLAVGITDPNFGAYADEMRRRGIMAQWEAANTSQSYNIGSIIKDAVVFYGTAYAAASGLQALQATAPSVAAAPAAAVPPGAPAGAITSGGGGAVITAASPAVAAPVVTTAGAATSAGLGASIVETAAGIAATATTAIVAAKVQKEVAPPAPGTNVGLPIVNDAGVQPNDQPATRSAGITAPLALAALLGAAFIL